MNLKAITCPISDENIKLYEDNLNETNSKYDAIIDSVNYVN